MCIRDRGGEDRYLDDTRTQTRIINAVYDNVHETKKTSSSGTPCINNNLSAYEAFIKDDSNEWLQNNKEDKISNTVYRSYVISSNTYHITDAVRRLLKSLCAEEQSKDPRTTKVLLYNEKDSNQSEKIEKSRDNFENALAELYYPIRDAALLPARNFMGKEFFDKIPKKSLNDFDLEVYAMHQIDGEEEPVRLTFPEKLVK